MQLSMNFFLHIYYIINFLRIQLRGKALGQPTAHLLYRNICSSLVLRIGFEPITSEVWAPRLCQLGYPSIPINKSIVHFKSTFRLKEPHASLSLTKPLHTICRFIPIYRTGASLQQVSASKLLCQLHYLFVPNLLLPTSCDAAIGGSA